MAADGKIPLTFAGVTAYYTRAELDELRSLPDHPDNEAVVRFLHEWKSLDPDAELQATGPRLVRGRYGT